MPEMKNSFQKGRMNKDLDERIVPVGEYRDALNVEVSTSESSNIGALQTIKGNLILEGQDWFAGGTCIGSVANHKNDKLYFMVSGPERDLIVEYDYNSKSFLPVCVDLHLGANHFQSPLKFKPNHLITGINVIDDMLFWTDNNSEPKRINITRGKRGSTDYNTHTKVAIKNPTSNQLVIVTNNDFPLGVPILEKNLTVIKQGPPAAPVLEMIDTEKGDWDGDGQRGGDEIHRGVTLQPGSQWVDSNGEFATTLNISVAQDTDDPTDPRTDLISPDYITIYALDNPSIKVRLQITGGGYSGYSCIVLAGDKDIANYSDYMVQLEQPAALFEFKLPRFAYRYKYEDGEYSPYSPFTEPAFLPGSFNYMPKEGYNLGMVNRVRKLVIKDFVHTRLLPEDVVSIDILYKESNSPNVYSVKTVKRRNTGSKWDEWNAISATSTSSSPNPVGFWGWENKTKGYAPITTEMIHAVLPSNQLLRPWDNVPRQALAQEIIGNRIVYGNYLQNYNLSNSVIGDNDIKPSLKVNLRTNEIGSLLPEEVQAGPNMKPRRYTPSKSIKSLRTYQLGVVYIDQYGRETPVFSDDKRGQIVPGETSQASVYNPKTNSDKRTSIIAELQNNPPSWATHYKYFVKETSNEYYNLAMDRWYNAEDGNIWLSFPSAERNKVDEDTYLILKKEHDNSVPVQEKARYRILDISNEAPRFIKQVNNQIASITDTGGVSIFGNSSSGYPLVGAIEITLVSSDATAMGILDSNNNIISTANCFLRMRSAVGITNWYSIRSITKTTTGIKIKSKTEFKNDMSITSASNTISSAITTCTLEIARRSEENRAEFDGRFFAKILKDNIVTERLGVLIGASSLYQTVSSMKVQYIDPEAVQAGGSGQWWGSDRYKLSIANQISNLAPTPGNGNMTGHGQAYWVKASKSTSGFSGSTDSSGWFIDKVEGYRPRVGAWGGLSINKRWATANPNIVCQATAYSQQLVIGSSTWRPKGYLNVLAMDVYQKPTFLGTSGQYQVASPGVELLDNTSSINGGQIARSSGIDNNISPVTGKENSTINISYSGMRENTNQGWGFNYPSTTWSSLTTHSFDSSAKHVDDIIFISKLITPGALWSWKEDPGHNDKPIIYRTIVQNTLTSSTSPYSLTAWANESFNDPVDNDPRKGLLIFNFAIFSDYIQDPHHSLIITNNWSGASTTKVKRDFVSRNISDHPQNVNAFNYYNPVNQLAWAAQCSSSTHMTAGARAWGTWGWGVHHKFPMGVVSWDLAFNQRRRWVIKVEVAGVGDQSIFAGDPVGSVGPHFYLPTNDCTLAPHFDVNLKAITAHPVSGLNFTTPAPGIRPDGMYSGNNQPGGTWYWNDGNLTQSETNIPEYKRFDAVNTPTKIPGSVTWQIKELHIDEGDGSQEYSSTNPAIWETEPKEDVGLDIYHEVGQIYPIYLNDATIEQFVGAVNEDITRNSYIQCWNPPYISVAGASGGPPGGATINLSTNPGKDIRVSGAYKNKVQLSDVSGVILGSAAGHTLPALGSYLIFWRADGSTTEAHVKSISTDPNNGGSWFELTGNETDGDIGVHNKMATLPWFNCYSFGNGVESDRIRDDYNQVTIDNGPKASTTIEGPYLEDRRKNGFIWSGIFNSTSGVNNLNQFIQAEAITKDTNPSYGSIQKLSARDSDLVAFCEDRVLKVLANKDALFNADGNTNVVATNKVLGTIRPFVGDYGISKNPESFASDSYRSYFADTSRGAIVRLSQDGLTPISNAGMKDWFSDNLPKYGINSPSRDGVGKIIGSFDDKKQEYNITLDVDPPITHGNISYSQLPHTYTLSYSENSKGWVSFKSFAQENGVSLNNSYFTFKAGKMFEHHSNATRNNFYLDIDHPTRVSQFDSSVEVLLNQAPDVIKSFSTLNYEGSQARITQDINNNPDYYDNIPKDGWYLKEMISNAQELGEMEFWDKEDKWFSQIKGVKTEWRMGDAGNIDPREFSYQGIGNSTGVSCPTCPVVPNTFNCIPGYYTTTYVPGTPGVPGVPGSAAITAVAGYYTTTYYSAYSGLAGCGQLNHMAVGTVFTTELQAWQYYCNPANGVSGIDFNTFKFEKTSQILLADTCESSVNTSGGYNLWTSFNSGNMIPAQFYPVSGSQPSLVSGYNPLGYSNWNALLTEAISIGVPGVTMSTDYDQFFAAILIFNNTTISANASVGGDPISLKLANVNNTGSVASVSYIQGLLLCHCESIWVPPVVGAAAVTAVPAIPAVPSSTSNSWVPGYCVPVSGGLGTYSTLANCQSACIIPSTWNCVTATSSTGGNPTTFCDEIFNGTGTYTSLGSCQAACPPYSPPPPAVSFDCLAGGVCVDPGNGSGQYATLSVCQSACSIPVSYDCAALGQGCYDPGNGLGQYSTLQACLNACPLASAVSYECINNQCIDPGNGLGNYTTLAACQAACTITNVGPCNIVGATIYDNTVNYLAGDVVDYLGFYYEAGVNILPNQNNPGSITTDWIACQSTFVGPCDVSAALPYDETISYSAGDVVQTTIWNGNVEYFHTIDSIPANYTHQPMGAVTSSYPGGYNQSTYDPITNTTNPWVSCSTPLTLIGNCLVAGYTNYDSTVTYGGPNAVAQQNASGEIWVFYQGNYYSYNCERWFDDIDYSTSTSFATGLPYTSSEMSSIVQDMMDACNNGIINQPPTGDHTGYWEQCAVSGNPVPGTTGCCDDTNTIQWNLNAYGASFDAACWNDPNCQCNYNLCI